MSRFDPHPNLRECIDLWHAAHPDFEPVLLVALRRDASRYWIVTQAGREQHGQPVGTWDTTVAGEVSEHGAAIAAGRLGITVAEYRDHEAAGERWCSRCEDWRPAWRRDKTSGAGYCPPCTRGYQREAYRRRNKRLLGVAS